MKLGKKVVLGMAIGSAMLAFVGAIAAKSVSGNASVDMSTPEKVAIAQYRQIWGNDVSDLDVIESLNESCQMRQEIRDAVNASDSRMTPTYAIADQYCAATGKIVATATATAAVEIPGYPIAQNMTDAQEQAAIGQGYNAIVVTPPQNCVLNAPHLKQSF